MPLFPVFSFRLLQSELFNVEKVTFYCDVRAQLSGLRSSFRPSLPRKQNRRLDGFPTPAWDEAWQQEAMGELGLSYALAKGKHFTREEFVSMLLTSVNDIDSRFEGSKTSGGTINLEKYRGKMGTGLTDAYQLLMQIEGTPCLKVKTGKLELVTLTKHFGGSAKDLTYMGVEVSAEDMQKLGMAVEPKMYNGQLMIKCTKPGVAHITVKAVGGGNRPGTGSVMGGIEITKTFAVIARETGAENGGWL